MRAIARVALVLALAALDLSFALPDLSRTVNQIGFDGLKIAYPCDVAGVVPGSAAAKANISGGDLVRGDSSFDRLQCIIFFAPGVTLHPGMTKNLTIVHGTQVRNVTLVSGPYVLYPAWMTALRVFVEIFWVALATFLVMRRPNLTTWSYFLFSIYPNISPNTIASFTYPHWVIILFDVIYAVFAVVGPAAGMVFILSLGEVPVTRWRRFAGALLVPLLVIVALPYDLNAQLRIFTGAAPSILKFGDTPAYIYFQVVFNTIAYLTALICLYIKNRGISRQQITWVLAGVATVQFIGITLYNLPSGTPFIFSAALYILEGVLPVCVTYAVLKHRLIDINFFISRTVVYAILSGAIIALLGLLHWLFSKQLDNQRLGTFVDVLAAVGVGFGFNQLHRRVDYFVYSVFFRRKHLAEKHLYRIAKTLQNASSETSIVRDLVDEPATALELSSAALFKRNGTPEFHRVYARGWGEGTVAALADHDSLMRRLHADREAIVLDDVITSNQNLPQGSAKPDIVLPIHVLDDLVAVVFYGGHEHGEHLDGDEIKAISALAVGASVGYAHLRARSLKDRAESAEQQAAAASLESEQLRREIDHLLRQASGGKS